MYLCKCLYLTRSKGTSQGYPIADCNMLIKELKLPVSLAIGQRANSLSCHIWRSAPSRRHAPSPCMVHQAAMGVNVLLVSASSKDANHAYLCLSWLVKAYLSCKEVLLQWHIVKNWLEKVSAYGFQWVTTSKCLKSADIVFIPIGDCICTCTCIFFPTQKL